VFKRQLREGGGGGLEGYDRLVQLAERVWDYRSDR
jgi:hypothetical protein